MRTLTARVIGDMFGPTTTMVSVRAANSRTALPTSAPQARPLLAPRLVIPDETPTPGGLSCCETERGGESP